MTKLAHYCSGVPCSKGTAYRLLFILGLFLFTYLFIYKFDIKVTIASARNMLTPLTNHEQKNSTVITTTTTTTTTTTVSTTSKAIEKRVEITSMNIAFENDSTSGQNTNISEQQQQPKEAFVTFSNNNPTYLALFKVLLDSVHAFSTRPIIAFGIDVDLDVDVKQYPRLIKRRIAQSDCGPSVYFCKLHAIVSSNVEYGVLMETDDVVNYNVDILFDVLHVWPYPLPLSPRHPDDPQNYGHFMRQFNVSGRTTPYIHAHIIWNYRALPFLKNVQSLLRQGNFIGANFDETAVNVMLWKAGANHTLCKYDPYFTFSEAYERWPIVTNCTRYCRTAFVTLHGGKDLKESTDLLIRLKANVGKPALQLPGAGGMRHLNDTIETCCEPDSKRSPIHPLLCEHKLPL